MTSRETVEDVLREIRSEYCASNDTLICWSDRIERALAGRAEAVAWRYRFGQGPWLLTERPSVSIAKDGFEAVPLYTHPPASVPEVTDAMVERFARRYYEITGRSIDRAYTLSCLTDALQEQRHG